MFPHCDPGLRVIVLSELEHFTRVPDAALVHESVRAIGRCASVDAATAARCMNLLLRLTANPNEALVAEALTVVRQMVQHDPAAYSGTIVQLAKNLDTITSPRARARR